MKQPGPACRFFGWLSFCCCLLLFAAPLFGAQYDEEMSTEEYLFVKGIVKSVSVDDQTLTLKQNKGPAISFFLDEDTLLEGFYHLSDLKPRQKIKVWYLPKEPKNKALKILKPLELGC